MRNLFVLALIFMTVSPAGALPPKYAGSFFWNADFELDLAHVTPHVKGQKFGYSPEHEEYLRPQILLHARESLVEKLRDWKQDPAGIVLILLRCDLSNSQLTKSNVRGDGGLVKFRVNCYAEYVAERELKFRGREHSLVHGRARPEGLQFFGRDGEPTRRLSLEEADVLKGEPFATLSLKTEVANATRWGLVYNREAVPSFSLPCENLVSF